MLVRLDIEYNTTIQMRINRECEAFPEVREYRLLDDVRSEGLSR